jgi:ribonuclease BN (tRNA processing enzyme)
MEALFPGSTSVERKFAVEVTEMAAGADYEFGDMSARAYLADHASGAPSHILRLEWHERVIAYSGDTAWTPALVAASRGTDLLICEAYFRDKKVPYHLSYAELIEHLAEFESKRIVLTHMTSEMIAANDVELERAFDGMAIDI